MRRNIDAVHHAGDRAMLAFRGLSLSVISGDAGFVSLRLAENVGYGDLRRRCMRQLTQLARLTPLTPFRVLGGSRFGVSSMDPFKR
jgi:hypothetical protein